MTLEEAEAGAAVAVQEAFAEFMVEVRERVFADPANPDWLAWPADQWPVYVQSVVVPVLAFIFAEMMRSQGVTDEAVIADAVASFVSQDVPVVADATTVPDRVYEVLFGAVAAGAAVGALLSAGAAVWAPMLSIMALNGGALAFNAAVFTSASIFAQSGRRRVVKTWMAREDERTRLTHKMVDNTTVDVGQAFNVGGFPLRYPHDPFGPIQETVNCRCRLRFGVQNG